jgi:hypothetical protein
VSAILARSPKCSTVSLVNVGISILYGALVTFLSRQHALEPAPATPTGSDT